MSTWLYLACIDHEPPLVADGESQQHAADWQIAHIRSMVERRAELIAVDMGIFEVPNDYDRNTLRFLRQHPSCRVALQSEYGDWHDMGHGVPEGKEDDR